MLSEAVVDILACHNYIVDAVYNGVDAYDYAIFGDYFFTVLTDPDGDSYTGSMIHNYYLYEKDGQMSMIPWDYKLAFGTFDGRDATGTVNTPIDSPVSGGSGEDRPMWTWILSDETWTGLYHQYVSEFLNSVDIQGIIDDACPGGRMPM